jgi:hypothetical protein
MMTRASPTPDGFAATYPYIAAWVRDEEGWIEVGSDEFSASFVRAVYGGGLAWEGEPKYPSMDEALRALDTGIAAWLRKNRPWSIEEQSGRQVRRGRGKGGTA